eukprot:13691_1
MTSTEDFFKIEKPPKPDHKIKQICDSDGSCATFQVYDEDHTLGNALRYVIVKRPQRDVDFCGYSIPHPSLNVMNLRIQTKKGSKAEDIFRESLRDLSEICDHMQSVYDESCEIH